MQRNEEFDISLKCDFREFRSMNLIGFWIPRDRDPWFRQTPIQNGEGGGASAAAVVVDGGLWTVPVSRPNNLT